MYLNLKLLALITKETCGFSDFVSFYCHLIDQVGYNYSLWDMCINSTPDISSYLLLTVKSILYITGRVLLYSQEN